MPTPRLAIPAAVALAVATASAAAAQPDARPADGRPDSTLATLVTSDGGMRVTLTGRSLRIGFTALGQRRIRHAADSAYAATYGAPGVNGAKAGRTQHGRADDVPASPGDDAARPGKPDKPIPLREAGSRAR